MFLVGGVFFGGGGGGGGGEVERFPLISELSKTVL